MANSSFQALINIDAKFNGTSAFAEASRNLRKISDETTSLSAAVDKIKGIGAAFGVAFGVSEIFQSAKGILEFGANLDRMSEKTGIATEYLNGFVAAAQTVDIDMETVKTSLKKFSVNVVEAAQGVDKTRGYFKALGIDVKDASGKLKSNEEIIKQVANAFKGSQDGAEKTAIALALFGKTGADLVPVLNKGSEGIDRLGLKMGGEFASRAHEASETFERIGLRIKEFGISAVDKMLPAIQRVANAFEKYFSNNEASQFFEDLGQSVKFVAATFVSVYGILANGFDTVFITIKEVLSSITLIGRELLNVYDITVGIGEKLIGNKAVGDKLISDSTDKIKTDFTNYTQSIAKDNDGLFERVEKRATEAKKFITDIGVFDSFETDKAKTKPEKTEDKLGNNTLQISEASNKIKEQSLEIERLIQKKQSEIALLIEEADARGKLGVRVDDLRQKRQFENEIANRMIGLEPKVREQLESGKEAILKLIEAYQQLKIQQEESFGQGAKEAFDDYLKHARNTAEQVKRLFSGMFKQIEDVFVDFIRKGKLDFQQFADFIIEELLRIGFQKAVLGIATTIGTIASGGAAGATSGASAGAVEGGASIGSGFAVAAKTKSSDFTSAESAVNVTVNVNVDNNGNTLQSTEGGDAGAKGLGQAISSAVKAEIINQKRPGGLLYGNV